MIINVNKNNWLIIRMIFVNCFLDFLLIWRLRKKELASLAMPVEEVLNDLIENAKAQVKSSKKSAKPAVVDLPSEEREKIVISIQDKDDKKQFCIYKVYNIPHGTVFILKNYKIKLFIGII